MSTLQSAGDGHVDGVGTQIGTQHLKIAEDEHRERERGKKVNIQLCDFYSHNSSGPS